MAAKAIDLSTAGIKVAYAIEQTAGTKPTAFTNIPNPKSIPDTNPEPSYIEGLKDMGGALAITFGMSQVFLDMWEKLCDDVEMAAASNKRMWMEFWHPKLTKSFFFTCEPTRLGFPSADVDSIWDADANVTPTGEIGWAEAIAPTDAE